MPIVSVVLPVYNGEKFLREAIESILRQTFVDFEFIIVDDGSRDSTVPIVLSYKDERIRLLQNTTNVGIIDTLNRGLAQAQGKYICRMDADDIALPNRIEVQVEYLESHQQVAVVGANALVIDEAGGERGTEKYPETNAAIKKTMFVHNPFAHSTVMMRRAVLDELGDYEKRFTHNEDYDLWLRVAARYEVTNLPLVLLKRRVHGASITGAKETALTGFRICTMAHAIFKYYRNPLRLVYLVRPSLAYIYRRIRDIVAP